MSGADYEVLAAFIDRFTPAELDKLATLNERIMHHLDTGDSSGEDEPSYTSRRPLDIYYRTS
ncbi:hypothetical protein [Mycolicibacterium sp. HK-90]|uniref:hypothetical protein n=1 Tax=Mycolicibacterium sp. HK-90 TaxID=3056937 RepID=UPI00265A30FD|nr:hypothetical protein [Mycolicibacterium sp. HK-90]WKG00807.1 hypothetical protein QU592_15905 [Mycolicibacterium sp. HK-90]